MCSHTFNAEIYTTNTSNFTIHPQNQTVLFGDFASFSCSSLHCNATLHFHVNDKLLRKQLDYRMYNESDHGCTNVQEGELVSHMWILINNASLQVINNRTGFYVTCHLTFTRENNVHTAFSGKGFVEVKYPCELCETTCNKLSIPGSIHESFASKSSSSTHSPTETVNTKAARNNLRQLSLSPSSTLFIITFSLVTILLT